MMGEPMIAPSPSGRPRRFAFVSPNYYPRTCGVGDNTMRFAQELTRRGFDVKVFSRSPAQPNPEAPEVPVTGASGATPLLIARRLQHEIERFAPTDLIIQYTPHMLGASRFGSPASLWLAHAARRQGIHVVVVAHELFLAWNRRPDVIVGAALMRVQLAAAMKIAHRTLVTMEGRVQELAALTAVAKPEAPIGVVRIGSSALQIARRPHGSGLRMGMFSTLASTKRFDVMLDCFRRVCERRPDAELIVIGDLGDPEAAHVRALQEAIAAHPNQRGIRVTGKLDLPAVAREVAAMDIYLFPMTSGANTRSSTLPLALGTGLPVVAIDSYETDPIFVDGENVLFAPALTGEAFADAVLRIAEDRVLAARLSEGALALYREHLAWEKIADQLLSLV
jgi:glycosyltransferase involved in cell wall biosynthesis